MDTEAAVTLLTDRAMAAFGRIDLLVSTVGGAPHPLPFDTISEEQLLETFRLNTWPTLALIRAALTRGLGNAGGSVVAISSGSPRKTTSSMISYASAKAARARSSNRPNKADPLPVIMAGEAPDRISFLLIAPSRGCCWKTTPSKSLAHVPGHSCPHT